MRTRNLDVFGTIEDSHVGIPGSVPSPAAPVPPRNDSLGLRKAPKHFFLSAVDNIPIRF
ncbi:hypothetical protein SAMN05216374_3024, partial [Tardiphaga sp. OK246]